MAVGLESTKAFRAKVQRAPNGRLFGVAIFLPADVIEPFMDDGTEAIEFGLIRMPGGIHLKIGGDRS